MQRRKGYRKPPGAVVVTRQSKKWGNPWRAGEGLSRGDAVAAFESYLATRRNPPPGWVDTVGYPSDEEIREELGGRDLACFCSLDGPCHRNPLLRIAASPPPDG